MDNQFDIVLASSSPRRRDFLKNMGITFEIQKPNIDESVLVGENAIDYVVRLSKEKARVIAEINQGRVVLAADTIVVCDNEILGKPQDREDAKRILRTLSGRTHEVMTSFCVIKDNEEFQHLERTKVTFDTLDEGLIETYVASGECDDKSGAYAVQGIGAMFITKVEGSVSSVVGLPICQVRNILSKFNIYPRTVKAQ